ncbi:MAG: polysaccharide deacetylase family protein [Candidatus Taylorbacteria bacterium]
MFTFRRLTLVFFLILLCLNLWSIFQGKLTGGAVHTHVALLYSLLLFFYFGLSFAFAFLPCTNFHHPVTCRGNMDEKSVAISFDDGPHPAYTPAILDILQKHQVKATFFCIGKNISNNRALLKRMDEQGHLIGNHSFSHSKWFGFFSSRRIRAELVETDNLIQGVIGKTPAFFRPPFGVVNPMVSKALKKMHWQTVCWTIRTFDTMENEPRKISRKILKQLKPGAIILLHDFTPFSQHHLEELILSIQNAGYTIVPMDYVLNLPAYV